MPETRKFFVSGPAGAVESKSSAVVVGEENPLGDIREGVAPLYADFGRPAKPIRLMVGLLLLKQLENLSDERVVEAWVQNPNYQAFCGMDHFQWQFPCDPSELVHFRKRIGESGAEKIFQASVLLYGGQALEREVVIDTTAQEKNITFPTDTKLRVKWMRAVAERLLFVLFMFCSATACKKEYKPTTAL